MKNGYEKTEKKIKKVELTGLLFCLIAMVILGQKLEDSNDFHRASIILFGLFIAMVTANVVEAYRLKEMKKWEEQNEETIIKNESVINS